MSTSNGALLNPSSMREMPDSLTGAGSVALTRLDLTSPAGLERAEQVTGAVARAIAHEPALRFRSHLLHVGQRIAPARAPHVRPTIDTQDLADLRGGADGIALRLLHSSSQTFRDFRPEGPLEDLLYEILEQFRVEALAPIAASGMQRNLTHRFDAWSSECIASGLLENHVGLLLFSAIHVCRSRILATPIEETVSGMTESTRFGIYEVMGSAHLLALRPSIHDQAAFAHHAAAIATAIGALADSHVSDTNRRTSPTTKLSMLALPDFDHAEESVLGGQGSGLSRLGDANAYRVFMDDYDRTVDIGETVSPHSLQACRDELDELVTRHRPLGGLLHRRALQLFPEPALESWSSEQEEGYLDPRLLAGVVTGSHDGRIYRRESTNPRPQGVVSILVDCSGSMKSIIRPVAVLVELLVRALDTADIATEVLGFTTGAWNGGRPYRDWLTGGRPAHPGRMNEALHLVFKDSRTSYRRARGAMAGLLWTPVFREGLDGEALEWAYRRLRTIDAPRRHMLVICDGSPMDGATTLTNSERYLDRHLAQVVDQIEVDGDVRLAGLGIGHDLSTYLTQSRIIDPDRILDRSTVEAISTFLAPTAGDFGNSRWVR